MADSSTKSRKSRSDRSKKGKSSPPKGHYECYLCGEQFSNKTTCSTHLRMAHMSKSTYTCIICEFKSNNKLELVKHSWHQHDGTRVCRFCGLMFTDKQSRYAHLESHHERTFQCAECGLKFWTKTKLTIHMDAHADGAHYKCDQCPRIFQYQTTLAQHKKYHTDQRIQCDLCDKVYPTQRLVDNHKRIKHLIFKNPKPELPNTKCTMCDKILSSANSLRLHMRRHTGQNLRRCTIEFCDYGATSPSDMVKHLASHSDHYTVKCDLCPKGILNQYDGLFISLYVC